MSDTKEPAPVVFHNCKPIEESALVISVGPDSATQEQLDQLTTTLNALGLIMFVVIPKERTNATV